MDKLRGMKTPQIAREGLAEMMGTLVLCTFGVGSVAQYVLAKEAFGGYWSVNWGWGLGVAFGIYWSGGISGGHINPAVSLALAVCGRFKWQKLPVYWAAQMIGAIIGSALAFGVYHDYLINFTGNERFVSGGNGTAGIWSTYPPEHVSNWTGFADQVLGTALFVGTIFALLDAKNIGVGANIAPFLIGLIVLTMGTTFGINAGFGLNPARDLGPRIFTAMAGWGSTPFNAHNSWWIYPVLGQFIGGVLGGLAYELTIAIHHDIEDEVTMVESGNGSGDAETKEVQEEGGSASGSKNASPRTK